MAGMKWDIMPASGGNCPGESEISQGLLRHGSWGALFARWLPGDDPQTPSHVHIADRLAARYVSVEGEGVCICVGRVEWSEALLRQRAEYSTHFGLSTVAGLPDNRLQGREDK